MDKPFKRMGPRKGWKKPVSTGVSKQESPIMPVATGLPEPEHSAKAVDAEVPTESTGAKDSGNIVDINNPNESTIPKTSATEVSIPSTGADDPSESTGSNGTIGSTEPTKKPEEALVVTPNSTSKGAKQPLPSAYLQKCQEFLHFFAAFKILI